MILTHLNSADEYIRNELLHVCNCLLQFICTVNLSI